MHFKYCPDCGTKAKSREIGDEGLIPYCIKCDKPLFDIFPCCIIALVVNEYGEAALLRQNYISEIYFNLVSGYMLPGENAEESAKREINEELGLEIEKIKLISTKWFKKKDLLMIAFIANTKKTDFKISGEVDDAIWIPAEKALSMVHPKGSLSYFLIDEYLRRNNVKK